jgi:hypothetical protein
VLPQTAFLDDYFPPPDEAEGGAKRMRDSENNALSRNPVTTLHELLEVIIIFSSCFSYHTRINVPA